MLDRIATDQLTRLDKLLFRLEAQRACLGWAIGEIAGFPGIVLELGLGHGRTYDHLRKHLADRDIYVFDREVDCIADCTPPDNRLVLGDIADTLPSFTERFRGKVVLAHADMGTYDDAENLVRGAVLSRHLPALLAPGAIVLSDLPLQLDSATPLPLPASARQGRYFIYETRGTPGFRTRFPAAPSRQRKNGASSHPSR
ncbi:class I SAM-dependent methyltransferase [Mesorhizobium sp. IMUNJ 23232]|uniref:class I SAM-dependent methyltransferase n=1 Tax=Mesorhizobium sp. IMUNJ 23232 TaxID=3376064 RepID=UPI00379D56F0